MSTSVWTKKLVWAELQCAARQMVEISSFDGELQSGQTPPAPDLARVRRVKQWLSTIPADHRDVLWARATRVRWKQICWRYGISRPTAHRRLQRGLTAIVDHLHQGRKA